MRVLLSSISGALFLLAVTIPLATSSCSSGNAPAQADSGGGGMGGTGGTGGGGNKDSSAPDGSTNCGAGCYQPLGCDYKVSPPSSWGFTNFSVDTSTAVGSTSGATPNRVRLGLGGGTKAGQAGYADPTKTAVFTWETTEQDADAKVKLGTSMTSLDDVHTGYAWTTPAGIGGSAVNMHEVHVCGLKPGTTYYYAVGGGATGKEVWSGTQSFTTVPDSGKLTIGVYSDARDTVSTWQTVNQRMKTIGVNLHLIAGDIVDIGGTESLYQQWLSAIWQSGSGFLTLGEQLMVPIAGNHEYVLSNYAAQFYGNFAIPGTPDDGIATKTYASFDAGNTHFVLFDDSPISGNGEDSPPTDTDIEPQATLQEAWLKADLEAANNNRAKVPFIVFISHRGLFSTSHHAADTDVIQTRGVLVPLLDQYHVDLVFNGHDHEYERSNLLNAGTPATGDPVVKAKAAKGAKINSSQGTTYIINAGAGADPYAVGTTPVDYRATNTPLCVPGSGTTCASGTYIGCYVILELEGGQIGLTAYGITGSANKDTVIDSLTLTH
jgi:acid phosphatase type 7